MKIISRKEAEARGLKWYFNGRSCQHGHVALRQVANRRCKICAGAASRAFYWSNHEKEIERQRRYRNVNKEKIETRRRANYRKNIEECREKRRNYYAKTVEKQRARALLYRQFNRIKRNEKNKQYASHARAALRFLKELHFPLEELLK